MGLFNNVNPAYKVRAELEARIRELDEEISLLKREVVANSDIAEKRQIQIKTLQRELRLACVRLGRAMSVFAKVRLDLQETMTNMQEIIDEVNSIEEAIEAEELPPD